MRTYNIVSKRRGRMRVMLVYQAGIANVFEVKSFNLADYGREAIRLRQGGFRECLDFACGLGHAGAIVRTAHCNRAGDIREAVWSEDLDSAPFSESMTNLKAN